MTEALDGYLVAKGLPFERRASEWPLATERGGFEIEDSFPSVLSLKQVTPEVSEIYINSFSKTEGLASDLSARLATGVVVNHYQSVATASYWAYHAGGEVLRQIEAGDGDVYAEIGTRLDFEGEVLGRDVAEEGEQRVFLFDYEAMDEYNSKVGVPVEVYQQSDSGWLNFIVEVEKPAAASRHRPWWKLW
ncbi:MAG: hypothetical protein AAF657_18370 [Acidobacteriota bacterium]